MSVPVLQMKYQQATVVPPSLRRLTSQAIRAPVSPSAAAAADRGLRILREHSNALDQGGSPQWKDVEVMCTTFLDAVAFIALQAVTLVNTTGTTVLVVAGIIVVDVQQATTLRSA